METFFATCPRGLEESLAQEFRDLGGQEVCLNPGGVECQGSFHLCYRLNRESRIASRILWKVGQGRYAHTDDLYRLTRQLPWPQWFLNSRSIKVRIVGQHSPLRSLEFAGLRIKDGICDRFVADTRRRPSVDKGDPEVQIFVFVDANRVLWYLDTSGEPLFKRGWRTASGKAPLRENLAAGILQLIGWTGDQTLMDPMCGSGTFLIEGAMMGMGIAPGFKREFAFRHLLNFNSKVWEALHQSRNPLAKEASLNLIGFDRDPQAVKQARQHGQRLGVVNLKVDERDALSIGPPTEKGIMVTNPPYGVRLGNKQELDEWYAKFGDVLKQRFSGWRVFVLSADPQFPKRIRLAPSRRIPLFNGALESRLFEFRMVKGGHRKAARLMKQAERKRGYA